MRNAFSEFPEACDLSLEYPVTGELVIVIGRNYRTVGYVDEQGLWRQHFDGCKLEEFVDWYALR